MSSKNKTTITAESGKQDLFITREFDAPRELVFKAQEMEELRDVVQRILTPPRTADRAPA